MESRVFWFAVMCILCKDASGESIFTRVFASINNVPQLDAGIKDTQTERLIQVQTRPIETTWKNSTLEPRILHKSLRVRDLSVKTKTLSRFENARCPRYDSQIFRPF